MLQRLVQNTLLASGLSLIATLGYGNDIYQYQDANGKMFFTDKDRGQVSHDYVLLSVRKGWTDRTGQALTNTDKNKFDNDILYAARLHDVEPALVKAVIHAESHFNPKAISKAGAQGLMQLMPETAAYLNVHNPFNARANIIGGTKFISYLKNKFDRLDHVLAAYNAGEGNVRRHGGIPPFPETQRYVVKVQELLKEYRQSIYFEGDDDKVALR